MFFGKLEWWSDGQVSKITHIFSKKHKVQESGQHDLLKVILATSIADCLWASVSTLHLVYVNIHWKKSVLTSRRWSQQSSQDLFQMHQPGSPERTGYCPPPAAIYTKLSCLNRWKGPWKVSENKYYVTSARKHVKNVSKRTLLRNSGNNARNRLQYVRYVPACLTWQGTQPLRSRGTPRINASAIVPGPAWPHNTQQYQTVHVKIISRTKHPETIVKHLIIVQWAFRSRNDERHKIHLYGSLPIHLKARQ